MYGLVGIAGPHQLNSCQTLSLLKQINNKQTNKQTNIKHCLVTKHFTVWPPSVVLFDRVWSCLIKFERPSNIWSNNLKHFVCSRVWWPKYCSFRQPYQTCVARACVPRLLSRLYPLLTVWPLTLTSACLVTKHFPFGQAPTLVSFFLFSFSTGNAFR